MRREQLLEMLVAEKHRLSRASGPLRKELRHHIAYLEGRIKDLEGDIDQTVRRSDAWRRKSEIVRSVPGFGQAFCAMVLAGSKCVTSFICVRWSRRGRIPCSSSSMSAWSHAASPRSWRW